MTTRLHCLARFAFATAASVAAVGLLASAAAAQPAGDDEATHCDSCEEWNQPAAPFRIHGNTYFVGVHGLSAVLVATPKGLILLDGDLPQSAPLIEANIRALGYRIEDIRYILNSHVHVDHAGGIAKLQHDSHAEVLVSEASARALRAGHVADDDPQKGYPNMFAIPRVTRLRTVRDGEVVSLGGTALVAHLTPGHTPGSTTWTWRSCDAGQCENIVYADSLNAMSYPGFRFTGGHGKPDISATFRHSIATVAALPCDILITVHPGFSEIFERAARASSGEGLPAFVDTTACRRYADDALHTLEARLAEENPVPPQH